MNKWKINDGLIKCMIAGSGASTESCLCPQAVKHFSTWSIFQHNHS